jgi:methionine synthase II (cobalamin-independent)
MFAKEKGVPVERAALAARIRAAVAEVVKKQVEAGIDLVDDGEMSKPSYATYERAVLVEGADGIACASAGCARSRGAARPNVARRWQG